MHDILALSICSNDEIGCAVTIDIALYQCLQFTLNSCVRLLCAVIDVLMTTRMKNTVVTAAVL